MSDTHSQTQAPFSQLNLAPQITRHLSDLGYQNMTEVQAQTLPAALTGKDILAQAKTGSGKTASFALPMIKKLNAKFFAIQGLVLCPTRELAAQVAEECRKLARYRDNIKVIQLSGGVSIGPQIGSLKHGGHIVVGTPGRICDHLRKGTLVLDHIQTFVLDEADRMLDMGFAEDIAQVSNQLPKQKQTLLFSATFPDSVEKIAAQYLRQPEIVRLIDKKRHINIDQAFVTVQKIGKSAMIPRLLNQLQANQAVVFCNTKQSTHEITAELRRLGFSALGLHGDLDQKDRDRILTRFKQASLSILVATDVAARGLDVSDLPLVINADLPRDPDVYTHRIGRTGRAGKSGLAVSLYSDKESYKLEMIAEVMNCGIDKLVQQDFTEPDWQVDDASISDNIEATPWVTLALAAGKKNKLRAGDILGAITKGQKIPGDQVGTITIMDFVSYVAINRPVANQVIKHLEKTPVKGQRIKVRKA